MSSISISGGKIACPITKSETSCTPAAFSVLKGLINVPKLRLIPLLLTS